MFDDRVCPSCQVLLRDEATVCTKCGRKVETAKTGILFLDWPGKLYAPFARYLGPFWGGVATAAVFVLLFALFVAIVVIKVVLRLRH
jgi:hypothetical protein